MMNNKAEALREKITGMVYRKTDDEGRTIYMMGDGHIDWILILCAEVARDCVKKEQTFSYSMVVEYRKRLLKSIDKAFGVSDE